MTSPAAAAPRPAARDPLLGFALLMAALWVLVPALINAGQPGDHFEQFTWAHSMEGGYYKHPPLPTWLLAITIHLLGPTPYATYLVAGLMLLGTGLFTWLIARELIGPRLASLAVVLWGLHWAFTWKGQMLNHNSVMMFFIAAGVWLAIQAARRPAAWAWWAGLGVSGGLAMLAKYQSAVPLVGIIIALAAAGWLKRRDQWGGLLFAVVVCLAVFAPHVWWMATHEFVTLNYASSTVNQLEGLERARKLLSFSVLHLRMLLWVLAVMAVLAWWMRKSPPDSTPPDARVTERERRAWWWGLLGWPLAVLAVLCLAQGVRLQDHWGFQAMQFISLWLAWRLRGLGPKAAPRLVLLALVVHGLALATYSRSVWAPQSLEGRGRPDQFYPAQALADAVMRDWKQATACPLRYVVGGTYEAGMISVYSGQNPAILEGGSHARSPWIDLDDLKRAGAVYAYVEAPANPPGPLRQHVFSVPGGTQALYTIYWAIVPPTTPCR